MLQKEPPPDAERYADEAKTLWTLAQRAKLCNAQQLFLGLADLYDKRAGLAEEVVLHSLTAAALVATSDLPEKEDG